LCANFLIVGGGNLGSRHLQGLAQLPNPATIDVYDPNSSALDRCAQRVAEITPKSESIHKIRYFTSSSDLDFNYDLAINAVTSEHRLASLHDTVDLSHNWILEKILTQNSSNLTSLCQLFDNRANVWVNHMMRELQWLKSFKDTIQKETIQHISIDGMDWSMACNLTHHLDFISWICNANLVSLNVDGLDKSWRLSKRTGNYDICGKVSAEFENSTTAQFISRSDGPDRLTVIETDRNSWIIDEIQAEVRKDNKVMFAGEFDRQSNLTKKLAEDILDHDTCNLPYLHDCITNHRIFIDAFLTHWKNTVEPEAEAVPIT